MDPARLVSLGAELGPWHAGRRVLPDDACLLNPSNALVIPRTTPKDRGAPLVARRRC